MLSSDAGATPDPQPLLPLAPTPADYTRLQAHAEPFLPAVQAICQAHNLSVDQVVRLGEGTNVIFAVGEPLIVKLFPPYWKQLFDAERVVARRVDGRLSIPTPRIEADGELQGWPYLVMTRLHGRYLKDVWNGLDVSTQLRLASDLGRLMAEWHALRVEDLPELEADWPGLVQRRLRACAERHREQGVAENWLRQIPDFLASAAPLYPDNFRPVIVTGDVHGYHLLVNDDANGWRLAGLFDFDDARIGFHEYDLAATALFIMHGRRDLLRAFFLSYGYREEQLNTALSRRLLAYTLLHRYRPFNWVRDELAGDRVSTTLQEVAQAIYPFE